MGDLIGNTVEGTLYWVGLSELRRLRALDAPRVVRARLLADACRINALYMIARAGSGHIGSSFSSLDIVTWLQPEELTPSHDVERLYFSSKGHDAPGLYAALIALERLPFDTIHRLRQLGGLPGHPDVGTPGMVTNTGSLGMGISKAKGLVLDSRLQNRASRVFVMTGDGELQEGQIWESLLSAATSAFTRSAQSSTTRSFSQTRSSKRPARSATSRPSSRASAGTWSAPAATTSNRLRARSPVASRS